MVANSPTLLNTLPFDAEKDHKLEFTYSGTQIFAHKVIIRDNTDNSIVYDKKTSAMNTLVTIPANTLKNGKTYNFSVSVFDRLDVESPSSNQIILSCFKTPTFELKDIQAGYIIRNSYIDISILYEQINNELLDMYTVFLYAANKTTVIYSSGTKYASQSLTTRISGLTEDATYYLRATGKTVSGMVLDTGYIEVMCDYVKPDIFLAFRADNMPYEGSVRLTSHFILIEGESDPKDLIYIDNEKVSLKNGEKVWFDKGVSVKDFTCQIIAENIDDFVHIVTFDMLDSKVTITWNYGFFGENKEKKYYAELRSYRYIGSERLDYVQISNCIPPLNPKEQVHFWIKRQKGLFDIEIAKLSAKTQVTEVITI